MVSYYIEICSFSCLVSCKFGCKILLKIFLSIKIDKVYQRRACRNERICTMPYILCQLILSTNNSICKPSLKSKQFDLGTNFQNFSLSLREFLEQ